MFGCEAFLHIPKEKRTKLDPKLQKCIFIGYGEEQFGFRLWDPVHRKIVCSRDVIFHETSFLALQCSNKPDKEYIPLSLFQDYSTGALPHISHQVGAPMLSTIVEYNSQTENDEESDYNGFSSFNFATTHYDQNEIMQCEPRGLHNRARLPSESPLVEEHPHAEHIGSHSHRHDGKFSQWFASQSTLLGLKHSGWQSSWWHASPSPHHATCHTPHSPLLSGHSPLPTL